MKRGFYCATCGSYHDDLPMDFMADAPAHFHSVPEAERSRRCELTSDICTIDARDFFVRGNLEIPVVDGDRPFVWGVWISLSPRSFDRMMELWEVAGREGDPPYFGWLCTSLPLYPDTLMLKTNLHTRPVGQKPFVELEPTDHPLAREQREGITMERVREIAGRLMHGK